MHTHTHKYIYLMKFVKYIIVVFRATTLHQALILFIRVSVPLVCSPLMYPGYNSAGFLPLGLFKIIEHPVQ